MSSNKNNLDIHIGKFKKSWLVTVSKKLNNLLSHLFNVICQNEYTLTALLRFCFSVALLEICSLIISFRAENKVNCKIYALLKVLSMQMSRFADVILYEIWIQSWRGVWVQAKNTAKERASQSENVVMVGHDVDILIIIIRRESKYIFFETKYLPDSISIIASNFQIFKNILASSTPHSVAVIRRLHFLVKKDFSISQIRIYIIFLENDFFEPSVLYLNVL